MRSGRSSMPEPRPIELDAEAILAVLIDHGVEFVVISGFAALLYGDPGVTVDVDITPSRSRENRLRLTAALEELDAKLRARLGSKTPSTSRSMLSISIASPRSRSERPTAIST